MESIAQKRKLRLHLSWRATQAVELCLGPSLSGVMITAERYLCTEYGNRITYVTVYVDQYFYAILCNLLGR